MSLQRTKKIKKIETLIDDELNKNSFDNFWWEDEMFSKTDSKQTNELSKEI